MEHTRIVAEIDSEISRLQQVRKLLADATDVQTNVRSITHRATAKVAPKGQRKTTRHISAEGRKRIAEAQKKRWAAQKKAKAA